MCNQSWSNLLADILQKIGLILKSFFTKVDPFFMNSGQPTENVFLPGRFYTKYVSEIESDPVGTFDRCREALVNLNCVILIETQRDSIGFRIRFRCKTVFCILSNSN